MQPRELAGLVVSGIIISMKYQPLSGSLIKNMSKTNESDNWSRELASQGILDVINSLDLDIYLLVYPNIQRILEMINSIDSIYIKWPNMIIYTSS